MWRILLTNLSRKKLRLGLTLASIAVAFILLVFLAALLQGLRGGIEVAGQDRLITMAQSSFMQPLPRSYVERIRSRDDIQAVMGFGWLNAYHKEPRNRLVTYVVLNEASLMTVYPEIHVNSEQWQRWLSNRTGVLVGRSVMKAKGWKVGDVIPIRSATTLKKDGTNTWELKIDGIFDNDNGNTNGIYIHYDYVNESLAGAGNTTTWIVERTKDPRHAQQVGAQIDELFANSAAETKTSSEKVFVQDFINQIGNIGSIVAIIVGAVFFTMLLIASNTMSQAVRERVGEIAVMKTLGFQSTQVTMLVLAESLAITLLGGVAGMAIGTVMVKAIANALKQFLPLMSITPSTYMLSIAGMIVAGCLSGALPCRQAMQLKITDALRAA